MSAKRTVAEVLSELGPAAESRLSPYFREAGAAYPPQRLALLAFKAEKRLELWAGQREDWIHVRDYPVEAASGGPGPKLREGDRQVPEGIYRIVLLNPNSRYHLSMKLNYPNAFDLKYAQQEGRGEPGGDIFIHGKAESAGCLAIGDPAIEELFVLVARIGLENVELVVAPNDRRRGPPAGSNGPPWVAELYRHIDTALSRFSRPPA